MSNPLIGLHELITGPVDEDGCIDLLIRRFGADAALDPGAGHHLAARLMAVGSSLATASGSQTSALHFEQGPEVDAAGHRVQMYWGRAGDAFRRGFLLEDPAKHMTWVRARGEWQNPTPVLDSVVDELVMNLCSRASSTLTISWSDRDAIKASVGAASIEHQRKNMRTNWPDHVADDIALGLAWLEQRAPGQLVAANSLRYVAANMIVIPMRSGVSFNAASDDDLAIYGLLDLEGHPAIRCTHRKQELFGPEQLAEQHRRIDTLASLAAVLPLQALDTVAWEQLEHAYGSAHQVPNWLRGLAASVDDPDSSFENAMDPFYGALAHQGSIYTSTAFVVPFLGQLLLDHPALRQPILAFLGWVVSPYYPTYPSQVVEPSVDALRTSLSNSGAVSLALHRLWPQLTEIASADPSAAELALQVIAWLGGRASDTLAWLADADLREWNGPSVLVVAGLAGRTAGESPALAESIRTRLTPCEGIDQAYQIARCLLGDRKAVDALLADLTPPGDALKGWLEGNYVLFVARTVGSIPRWPNESELRSVLDAVEQANSFDQLLVLNQLSRLVLPLGPPASAADLTLRERLFLDRGVEFALSAGGLIGFQEALGLPPESYERYLTGDLDPTF